MKINPTQNQTSINVIARLQRRRFFIFSLDWSCSGTFQTFPACFGLFPVAPLFTSDEVTECFDLQFYNKSTSKKECKSLYKAGQLF